MNTPAPDGASLPPLPVYGTARDVKQAYLCRELGRLTAFHYAHCPGYRRILDAIGHDPDTTVDEITRVPFLPARLFKEFELLSVPRASVVKTLTSSGTTSQRVSRIHLDRDTAALQTKALVTILQHYLGKQRLPMLIVDTAAVLRDRSGFSARGAGILGLSTFGRDHTYLLDESMALDVDALLAFARRHAGERILVFGFTFMVWKYLLEALRARGLRLDLADAVLIHSGGWKKMQEQAVDNPTFKAQVREHTGIRSVHNFYGMVEQVGSIFMECTAGHLHTPVYADVLTREAATWRPLPPGRQGVIQVLSVLPRSYPGHSLLTEDTGTVLGEDDCACGMKGRYFTVSGRLPEAELRGCSDVHASEASAESRP